MFLELGPTFLGGPEIELHEGKEVRKYTIMQAFRIRGIRMLALSIASASYGHV